MGAVPPPMNLSTVHAETRSAKVRRIPLESDEWLASTRTVDAPPHAPRSPAPRAEAAVTRGEEG